MHPPEQVAARYQHSSFWSVRARCTAEDDQDAARPDEMFRQMRHDALRKAGQIDRQHLLDTCAEFKGHVDSVYVLADGGLPVLRQRRLMCRYEKQHSVHSDVGMLVE